MEMDYTIESAAGRAEYAQRIIAETPPENLTPFYLEKLADYIVFAMDKEERRQKKILTENRLTTINKRETSYEGLVEKLENGEDGIYNLISDNKNLFFQQKRTITDADVAEIPELGQLREAIAVIETQIQTARGKRAYLLRRQLIEMRQEQYTILAAYKKPVAHCSNVIRSFPQFEFDEKITMDENGEVFADGTFTLLNPDHVSALLCNYSKLKEETYDKFNTDAKWILVDLENAADHALQQQHPMLYDLLIDKIDGLQNEAIQKHLEEKYGIKHSVEYISSLWRKKIPKLIAEEAKKEWVIWHYKHEIDGKWKRCSRCKKVMPAHNLFFSKNNTSKDGLYSICKCCRNSKNKGGER